MSPEKRLRVTLACVMSAVVTACAPQPPKNVIELVVTNTPTPAPELPTATPEPTGTPTPKPPEPTKTPEPTQTLERFFQEVGILDIYTSDLFIVTKGKVGNILITRLPDDSMLVAYNTLSARTNGRKPTPITRIQKTAVRGGGFQFKTSDEELVVLLQGPSLGGQVKFNNLPNIDEPTLFSATKKGNGSKELFKMLAAMHGEVDPRLTPDRAEEIVRALYQGPLEPSK